MKFHGMKWLKYHLFCILTTAALMALMFALAFYCNERGFDRDTILILFMAGVLIVTVATKRLLYGFVTSAVSVGVFNYFYTPPYYSFTMDLEQDVIVLVSFLIATLGCGMLVADLRKQAEAAREKERGARLLYEVTEQLLTLIGVENIVSRGMEFVVRLSGYPCSIHLSAGDGKQDFYSENYKGERKSEGCSFPIRGQHEQLGVMRFPTVVKLENKFEDNLVKSIVFQMALALDREYSYLEQEKIKRDMENERLRGNLIRSISHDIRTPLTGIAGASSVILDNEGKLEPEQIQKLAADINEEASWLMTTVENILDMTRIVEGRLKVSTEYEAVDDMVNETVAHLPAAFDRSRLKIEMPGDILLLRVDGRLLVKVLSNLLDNAYKYAGEQARICLSVRRDGTEVVFEVADNGKGIDPSVFDTVFEQFVTLPRNMPDQGRGVGLGLAICRSVVKAMNGSIRAYNRQGGGAAFEVRLPYEEDIA